MFCASWQGFNWQIFGLDWQELILPLKPPPPRGDTRKYTLITDLIKRHKNAIKISKKNLTSLLPLAKLPTHA